MNINITKEEAHKQFNYMTEKLNLKHYFTFDEAWEYMTMKREQNNKIKVLPDTKGFREGITNFENTMRSIPNAIITGTEVDITNPVKHTFAGGCYIREIFNPKGELIVTKIHKVTHPFFLLKGDMSILTEVGPKRYRAPYWGVTKMGTKRIIYTHEECVFVTVHSTKQTNVKDAEEEIVAKDFDEVEELEAKNYIEVLSKEA